MPQNFEDYYLDLYHSELAEKQSAYALQLYIHEVIPNGRTAKLEIVPALEEHIKRQTTRKPRAPVKRTYKMKRAQLNQQHTLAEINAARSADASKE